MIRRTLPLVAIIGLLAGCGDDKPKPTELGTPDVTSCLSLKNAVVTEDELTEPCSLDDDTITGLASEPCDDGRVIFWNEQIQGVVGEKAIDRKAGPNPTC